MKTTTSFPHPKLAKGETLKEGRIYGNALCLMRNFHPTEPLVTTVWVILHQVEYDGKEVRLADWKANYDNGTCYVRGSVYVGNGIYHPIEETLTCVKEDDVPLKSPGKNWVYRPFSPYGQWRNVKTKEERRA